MASIKLKDLFTAHCKMADTMGVARIAMIVFKNIWKCADIHEMIPDDLREPHRYLSDELGAAMGTRVKRVDVPDDILPDLRRRTYDLGVAGAAIRFTLLTG